MEYGRLIPMRIMTALLAGAVLVSSAVPALADVRATRAERGAVKLASMLEGRAAGKPVDCIDLRRVQSTEVIDGHAIVYRLPGGKLYVNEPRSGKASLDRDDILVTKTHSDQLCSIDIVRLYDRAAQFETGFVGLGKFTPYDKVAKAGE
jgi:hypothetical protein